MRVRARARVRVRFRVRFLVRFLVRVCLCANIGDLTQLGNCLT